MLGKHLPDLHDQAAHGQRGARSLELTVDYPTTVDSDAWLEFAAQNESNWSANSDTREELNLARRLIRRAVGLEPDVRKNVEYAVVRDGSGKAQAAFSYYRKSEEFHLAYLAVAPWNSRRIKGHPSGYGTRAIAEVAQVFLASDATKFKLTSLNDESDAFYQALGMIDKGNGDFEWSKRSAKSFIHDLWLEEIGA